MKKIHGVLLLYALLYVFMYLLLPRIFPPLYLAGNESLFVFLSLTTVCVLMAMLAYSDKIIHHLLGLGLYGLLMFIYTEPGAYGIGMVGMNLDGMSRFYDVSARYLYILIWLVITLIIQVLVWLLVKSYRKFKSGIKK